HSAWPASGTRAARTFSRCIPFWHEPRRRRVHDERGFHPENCGPRHGPGIVVSPAHGATAADAVDWDVQMDVHSRYRSADDVDQSVTTNGVCSRPYWNPIQDADTGPATGSSPHRESCRPESNCHGLHARAG